MDFNGIVADVKNRLSFDDGMGSDVHKTVLELIRKCKKQGQDVLDDYIGDMEKADRTYRIYRYPDDDDKKAMERGEPPKLIYGVTYAQIQTLVAALMATFNRTPFFQLEGRSPAYSRGSKLFELELSYQLDQISWTIKFYQILLDALRYGFGKLNIAYTVEESWIRVENQLVRAIPMLGFILPSMEDRKVVGYQGSCIEVDDPFNVMFDPEVSIGDIQRGQFVFEQEYVSFNQVKTWSKQRNYFNLDRVSKGKMPMVGTLDRRSRDRTGGGGRPSITTAIHGPVVKGGEQVLLDCCYVKLIPSDYGLSELSEQQIWKITMANEAVIIGAEPSRYEHGKFPVATCEYSPDLHSTINDGMAQSIDAMQELVNWLWNSRIASVRKTINNQFLVDESMVELSDIEERRNYIRRTKLAGGRPMDQILQQIPVADVTQSHLTDVAGILRILQQTTGISDNTTGIQLPTTRTATEVQTLQRNAAGRVDLLARLIFSQCLRPMGMQMIQNSQAFMQESRFQKVSGSLALQLGLPPELVNNGFVKIGPEDIQGFYTIAMLDVTENQNKSSKSQVMSGVLQNLFSNPMAIQLAGADVSMMLIDLLTNAGYTNASDFVRPPTAQTQNMILAAMMAQSKGKPAVQAEVMPDDKLQSEVQKGNLTPVDASMRGTGGNGGTY